MIITELEGGLGNQLFQYAVGRCLAYKNNTKLKLDIQKYSKVKDSHHGFYKLDKFNIKENFATPEDISKTRYIKALPHNKFVTYILNAPDNIFLSGYWQSEKYFLEIEDIIRREFTLKNPLEKKSAAWKEKILTADCSVSLHVRHGDYLTHESRNNRGILPVSYYKLCINELQKNFKDITIFVFSDDMQWCKENLNLNATIKFVDSCEHDYEELYLMSLCSHNIISPSTFAWWGAWLNPNPDKKVFAPYPWHTEDWSSETIISNNWIKIPVDYSLSMPPMLSIIVCVENNISKLNLSLLSILSQNFYDYEVILIDNSVDGSGKICRQATNNEKVTLLKVSPDTKKTSAWNKGLDVARGDYVLFLTSKDFLLPYAAKLLSDVGMQYFKITSDNPENYLTFSNYDNYMPNIVCSIQRIEDLDENINLNNILDSKFSLKIDSLLQDINGITELTIPNNEKLSALGSGGINSLVGTKFFKRSFLNENNIRFRKGSMDAELLFLVETFVCTEKITFVPQLFYGQLK